MKRAVARVWNFLAWIVGTSFVLLAVLKPPTVQCYVPRGMRSSLLRQSFWSRRFTGVVAVSTAAAATAARNPSNHLAQSYFERHFRLFATSSSSSSSSVISATMNDQDKAIAREYTDYEKWVRRLYMTNLFHPVKMGLTNMQQLHEIMGNPMDDVSVKTSTFFFHRNLILVTFIIH